VPRPWGNFRTTAIEKFAADVIEEVVETWDVRYSNPTPAQAKARKSAKKTPKAKKTVKAGKAKKTVKKTKKAKRKK